MIVMAKMRDVIAPTEQSPEMLTGLFPCHDSSPWPSFVGQLGTGTGDEERVTVEELAGIEKTLSVGKTPGPGGVPNLGLKVAITEAPMTFRSAMQKCLHEAVFPEVWKRQSLTLLPKAGKLPAEPSAYRPTHGPTSLIDMAGKVLKKILLSRLLRYT